jgi:hypothetical protein
MNNEYVHFGTGSIGRYLYGIVITGLSTRLINSTQWDVEYDPIDRKFYDVGIENPQYWGLDELGTNIQDFPTPANIQTK